MTEQELHEYNKWLTEVWNPNQIHIPFMEDAPSAFLEYRAEQSGSSDVKHSVFVDIVDSDIAKIEALHDLLVDAHGYSLDFITLKRARELTGKMYAAFKLQTNGLQP